MGKNENDTTANVATQEKPVKATATRPATRKKVAVTVPAKADQTPDKATADKPDTTKKATGRKPKPESKPEKQLPAKAETKNDVYSKEFLTASQEKVSAIENEMKMVETSFMVIAFNLNWIYTHEAFKAFGYKDVYKFANDKFKIARGTTNNFINVVKKFGKPNGVNQVTELKDEYKGYSSSQLIAMLGVADDKTLKALKPDMSVRDIKQEVKKAKGEDKPEDIEVEAVEVKRQVLITFKTIEEYNKQVDKLDEMILRALKEKGTKSVEVAFTF